MNIVSTWKVDDGYRDLLPMADLQLCHHLQSYSIHLCILPPIIQLLQTNRLQLTEVVNVGPCDDDIDEDALPSQAASLSTSSSAALEINIKFKDPITMTKIYITSTAPTVEAYSTTVLKAGNYVCTVKGSPFKLAEESAEVIYDAVVPFTPTTGEDVAEIKIKCLSLKKRKQVHIFGITVVSSLHKYRCQLEG